MDREHFSEDDSPMVSFNHSAKFVFLFMRAPRIKAYSNE
jgi:hypothetical protein